MISILQRTKHNPSTSQRFADAFGQASERALQGFFSNREAQEENEALKKMGLDLSGVSSPEIRKSFIDNFIKNMASQKDQEDSGLMIASNAIDRMEELLEESGVGFLDQLNPFSSAQKNRGEFESLEASLFPLFKKAFPRMTQEEFKHIVKNYTPQTSHTIDTSRGRIKGLRNMLSEISSGKKYSPEQNKGKIAFNSQNPEHQAKAKQLFAKHRDKETVRKILSREFEGL